MYLLKSRLHLLIFFLLIIFVSCSQEGKKEETSTNNSSKESVSENSPVQNQSLYEVYLTTTDIEKISGITGVKLIPRNPKIGAGGDLNFAAGDDKMIVMVQIVSKNNYEGYKKYFFKSDITGLGERAMKGATIPNFPENVVAFTKGDKCIALTVFVNKKDFRKNMLSIEQTTELAKIIDSRM